MRTAPSALSAPSAPSAPSTTEAISTRPRESLGGRLPLIEQVEQVLRQATGVNATTRGSVPGRIEVLGKHVDYAGGRSIVCAVERGFVFAAAPRRDNVIRAIDVLTGESRATALAADHRDHLRDWGAYVATVARRVARDASMRLNGVDFAFASDLPPASGLSSSTALLITTFLAIAQANARFAGTSLGALMQESKSLQLADYLAAVESGRPFSTLAGDTGVGTLGGSQDHAAILFARRDHLTRFAFLPTTLLEEHALPLGLTFAIAFSGVHAEKISTVQQLYNNASLAAAEIVRLWHEVTGDSGVESLRDLVLKPGALAEAREIIEKRASTHFTSAELLKRLDHFSLETRLHISAAGALAQHDWVQFGDVVAESQRAAEELLGNQVEETSYLARAAREAGGLAASAFGAGFGGSVWALVHADDSDFLDRWRSAYAQRFPPAAAQATFFTSRPADAAYLIA